MVTTHSSQPDPGNVLQAPQQQGEGAPVPGAPRPSQSPGCAPLPPKGTFQVLRPKVPSPTQVRVPLMRDFLTWTVQASSQHSGL